MHELIPHVMLACAAGSVLCNVWLMCTMSLRNSVLFDFEKFISPKFCGFNIRDFFQLAILREKRVI